MAKRKSEPSDSAVVQFMCETGRFPSGFELMMLREAQASVALDKGDIGTYSVEAEEASDE